MTRRNIQHGQRRRHPPTLLALILANIAAVIALTALIWVAVTLL